MIDKEEILEVEDKIEKALQKDKEAKEAENEAVALDTKEKESSELTGTKKGIKGVSSKATKTTKMDSSKTIVTPPPSIEKTKDNTKML